jgi:hypothetical protein
VLVIPSPGVDPLLAKRRISEGGITGAEMGELLRILVPREAGVPGDPSVIQVGGEDAWEDYRRCLEAAEELSGKSHGPILGVIGASSIANRYGLNEAIRVLGAEATKTRSEGGLLLLLLKPSREDLRRELGAIADVHLKIIREHGVPILCGVNPRTNLFAIEMDVSKGHPMPKLTPIL